MDQFAPKPFDTSVFFSGGAGMFLQYHDVVKPTYLTVIFKLLMSRGDVGLPLDSLRRLSIQSLIEWYLRRRYWNPLRSLDYQGLYSEKELDELLLYILNSDDSLYSLSPTMNVHHLLSVYAKQRMNFPVYVYTEAHEPNIHQDAKTLFPGINTIYLHGPIEEVLIKCDQNFTYMIADIELYQRLVKALEGTCSHLLLANDYRYNYRPKSQKFKYDLSALMRDHPFVRLETNNVCSPVELVHSIKSLSDQFLPEGKGTD
jgi:hypothetical protein